MPHFPNASKVAHKNAAIQLLGAFALECAYATEYPFGDIPSRESFVIELQSEEDSTGCCEECDNLGNPDYDMNEEHLQAYEDWRNEEYQNMQYESEVML
jgi:hypothetical protein